MKRPQLTVDDCDIEIVGVDVESVRFTTDKTIEEYYLTVDDLESLLDSIREKQITNEK